MLEKLKQAWKRDRLAVLGVGAAALAFLLWATPSPSFGISLSQYSCENGASGGSAYSLIVVQVISGCLDNRYDQVIGAEGWFTLERLPAIVSSLALGAVLLYVSVRRRGRARRIARSRAPQTLAVAIVSAAVSALVVTGAGLLLVNQVPSKTVFQTIYRDPTPTPQPFFTPSPSPLPTPTPRPTKAPLGSLSKREKATVNVILTFFREGLAKQIAYESARPGQYPWPFEIPVVKSSHTETSLVFTFTLTRWIPIDPYDQTNYVPFKFTSKCVFPRLSYPYPNDSDDVWAFFSSNLWPTSNLVTYDEYDSNKASAYPHEPTKWVTRYKYKSDNSQGYPSVFGHPQWEPAPVQLWRSVKGCY